MSSYSYVHIYTPLCLYIYSQACLIDLGDTFVITGGMDGIDGLDGGTTSTVSHYSASRHLGDLASLNTARDSHGCSTYTDSSQQQVRVAHGNISTDTDHVQVLLVAGGEDIAKYLSSTEILVTLAGVEWKTVGPLPTAVYGLSGATLDNTVFMLGEGCTETFIECF